jgi:hypothetical protein
MSAMATSGKDRSPLSMIAALVEKSRLNKQDLSDLQRALDEGCLSREEAEALFRLEGATTLKCPGCMGALIDYIVWQSRPTGVVDGEPAAWLLTQDDGVQTLGSLALLIHAVAEAHTVPASFVEAVRALIRSRSTGLDLPSPVSVAA